MIIVNLVIYIYQCYVRGRKSIEIEKNRASILKVKITRLVEESNEEKGDM